MASRWAYLLLLAASIARGSYVIGQGPVATTTLAYFGPQHFSVNATRCPMIELSASDLTCLRDGKGGVEERLVAAGAAPSRSRAG